MLRSLALRFTLLAYLTITGAALLFTLTPWARYRVPFVPRVLLEWSYGMMAPYQGDDVVNEDLVALGVLADGTEVTINLDPYFPVGAGERSVRKHLRTFKPSEESDVSSYREAYALFGRALLAQEEARGHTYRSVKLFWHEWPRSPGGYDFLHLPLFTEVTFIAEVR